MSHFSGADSAERRAAERALWRWQVITVVTLLVGYAGYYVCRANLAVATPLITAELGPQGIDKRAIGWIQSWGTLTYATGKLVNGILCDFVGGRRMFLLGMVASVLCTVGFATGSSMRVFLGTWCANRLVQSTGWAALVKVTARWFPVQRHGQVMGIISLSYLFGDALARWFLGQLIEGGFDWRQVFFAAAGVLSCVAAVSLFTLKTSPRDVGAEEPRANPDNVFGATGEAAQPLSVRQLLAPFLSSVSFWIVCGMSFGLTLIRNTFDNWSATYLAETAGVSAGQAAKASAWFPLVGGISVLAMGALTDRISPRNRGAVIFPFLLVAAGALAALARLEPGHDTTRPLVMIGIVSFFLIGPYSLLAGVMSLDLGGKQGSSTASGLIDSAGYLGGIVAGAGVQQLADAWGWSGAFEGLACVALVTTVLAGWYWWLQRGRLREQGAA